VGKRESKLTVDTDMPRSIGKQSGEYAKRKTTAGRICREEGFKAGVKD